MTVILGHQYLSTDRILPLLTIRIYPIISIQDTLIEKLLLIDKIDSRIIESDNNVTNTEE